MTEKGSPLKGCGAKCPGCELQAGFSGFDCPKNNNNSLGFLKNHSFRREREKTFLLCIDSEEKIISMWVYFSDVANKLSLVIYTV